VVCGIIHPGTSRLAAIFFATRNIFYHQLEPLLHLYIDDVIFILESLYDDRPAHPRLYGQVLKRASRQEEFCPQEREDLPGGGASSACEYFSEDGVSNLEVYVSYLVKTAWWLKKW